MHTRKLSLPAVLLLFSCLAVDHGAPAVAECAVSSKSASVG